jgi:circadian clock protein KaiC
VSNLSAAPSIARLSTGNAAMDSILGGGLPARSVTVIAGEPGSGKMIFTLQLLFHLAGQGKRCLYFTTLSEPALKLIHYMQLFPFFDQQVLERQIVFADLGSVLRMQGAAQALAEITARVESEEPDMVAIDSFKAFNDLLREPGSGRIFVYDLAVAMAGWGATTLLVGEYTAQDITTLPEFAIADGIIRLGNQRQGLTAVRVLEVLKLRGADYVTGQHFFEITGQGVVVYPRVRAPEFTMVMVASDSGVGERASSGITGLDALLHGGVPRRSSTVVQGGTGAGKTLLGLSFLLAGAARGERGVLFTLEETPEQLHGIAKGFGWDLPTLEADGLLLVHYTSPVELSTDRFLDVARRTVQEWGAQRAVLDSVSSAALGVPSERRFKEMIYALTKHFRAAGVTSVLTMEVAQTLGASQLTGHGVSSIADNVVLLRFVEIEARLERAISVLKARGVQHETELRRFRIEASGLVVTGPFTHYRGVLTGEPTRVQSGPQEEPTLEP